MHYILEGRKPRMVDLETWVKFFENIDRHVANENVGDVRVSTVFLGLDHSFGQGPPLLFETMVFGGPLNEEQVRYSTWGEAEIGHRYMVERVKSART
jgi:hypothetical protein